MWGFPSGFSIKNLYATLQSPTLATWSEHLVLPHLLTLTTFVKENTPWRSSLCCLPHSPLTATLLGQNTVRSLAPYSRTSSVCDPPAMRETKFHSYIYYYYYYYYHHHHHHHSQCLLHQVIVFMLFSTLFVMWYVIRCTYFVLCSCVYCLCNRPYGCCYDTIITNNWTDLLLVQKVWRDFCPGLKTSQRESDDTPILC